MTFILLLAVDVTAAPAATVVGTELPPAPTAAAIGCDPGPTCAGTALAGVRVPVPGVVTSWRTVASAPATLALLRRRGTTRESATSGTFPYGPLGLTTFSAGTIEQPVRLRVYEGDRLTVAWGGVLTGTIPADPASPFSYEVNTADGFSSPSQPAFQATIEPDADGDQLGDETQDLCPTGNAACPGLTFTPDRAPSPMPGQTVERRVTLSLAGPGRTPPGTQVFLEGKVGLSATLDGQACPPLTGAGSRRAACTIGAAGPARAFSLVVRLPDVRGPKTSVRAVVEAPYTAESPRVIKYWPAGPAAATVSTPVPALTALRPRVRLVSKLRKGRIGVRVACPRSGTQTCRVRVTLRRAGSGQRVFARASVKVRRGSTKVVRLRASRAVLRRLRRGSLSMIATATRLDLATSQPAGSATARVRAR